MFEAVGFVSGTRPAVIGRVAFEVPASRAFVVPTVELWKLMGSGQAGPQGVTRIWRAGIGILF
ncbi:MAG: hypothetical protein R2882_04790 [Gemmatimonadales bacterium]